MSARRIVGAAGSQPYPDGAERLLLLINAPRGATTNR